METLVNKTINFTHHSTSWFEKEVPKKEEKWDNFIRFNGLPYLLDLCVRCGIDVDAKNTGDLKVERAYITFRSYNILNGLFNKSLNNGYISGTIETPRGFIVVSSAILGKDRIMQN